MDARPPNLRHFAALAATVRHGSLSRAARAVNLTQPALTQAISGLENGLGVSLFERGPCGMTPTPPAVGLAARAEAALAHVGSSRVTGTQVRAFLAVARAGSYVGAADLTGLSSASLHRAVADLSVALGQRLIERRGRSVILTPAGQRRARGFGLAMAEIRAGLAEIAAWQGRTGGRIVVGAMPLSRARWLPDAIARFLREQPGTDVTVIEGAHADMVGSLRDGDIDMILGALRDPAEVEGLIQDAVFVDRPALVMRAGHPLTRGADPTAAMLSFPWFLPARGTPLRRFWEDMVRALGLEPPHVAVECGSVMMIRQLLLAGDGLTLLSPTQVTVELEAGVLATLAPPQLVERTIGITTRQGWRPTAAQAAFLTLVRGRGDRAET